MMIDTHAHYDDRAFEEDRDEVLKGLASRGVHRVINSGSSLEACRRTMELMEQYPFVYGSLGIHPCDTAELTEDDMDWLARQSGLHKCVAIGEIGLDYYWEKNPPRELQRRVFRDQMALAQELGLPVIVHDREAHADALAVVRAFPGVRGVFHCFSGSAEMARELAELGWMISFTGVLTYKNARRALEAAQAVPMDQIMIETDSPYMAPVPVRGQRNHSGNLCHICQRLAEVRGISYEECARITLENGKRFFSIP